MLPARNAERSVATALRSVWAQTYADFEVIVVDDASTDATADVVASASDRRLRMVRLDRHVGVGGARNVAVDAARGEWLTVLDADDVYHPARLERLVTAAEHHNRRAVVFDEIFVFDASDPKRNAVRNRFGPASAAESVVDRSAWLASGRGAKPFVHRDLVGSRRYPTDLDYGEDFLFLARVLIDNDVPLVQVHEALYGYRLQPGTLRARWRDESAFPAHVSELLRTARDKDRDALAARLVELETRVAVARAASAVRGAQFRTVARMVAREPRAMARGIGATTRSAIRRRRAGARASAVDTGWLDQLLASEHDQT